MEAGRVLSVSEVFSRNMSPPPANGMQETTQKQQRTSSTVKTSAGTGHGCYDRVSSNWGLEWRIRLGLREVKPLRYARLENREIGGWKKATVVEITKKRKGGREVT